MTLNTHTANVFLPGCLGPVRREVVLLEDAEAELAALREELATAKDDLVIFKSGLSALGEASKKLVFCARTTGGTSGPDQGLIDACAGVEGVITLAGIARAMNELERLTAERDDLKVRLEQARDRKNSIVDLQQRLTAAEQELTLTDGLLQASNQSYSEWRKRAEAAEQRNAELVEWCAKKCEERAAYYEAGDDDAPGSRRAGACQNCADVIRWNKPTESGASE